MTFATTLLIGLCLLHPGGATRAQGWRGIVPLHSTREEVRRLLGPPPISGPLHDAYRDKGRTVEFIYSDGPCRHDRKGGWNVPAGTVVSISVTPDERQPVSALKLDLAKFERYEDLKLPGVVYYTDSETGVTVVVNDRRVSDIYYNPVERDEHLACPDSADSSVLR